MPCRSPEAEWHEPHFASKYICPAARVADEDVQRHRLAPAGGAPCARAVRQHAVDVRRNGCRIVGLEIDRGHAGARLPRTIGSSSSPLLVVQHDDRDRSRFGPPMSPPRRSAPWQERQEMP